MTNLIKKLSSLPWNWIIGFSAIFTVFIVNGLYVSYPDEFVNLLASKAINAGKIPYLDFFDHHLPMAWYLGAIFLKFSFGNYVGMRILWAMFQFMGFLFAYIYIKKSNKEMAPYFLGFMASYPFFAVYFWLHIFLADSLACFFFSILFWILAAETFKEKSNFSTLLLTSLLSFCMLFSSLTFLFMTSLLYLWQMVLIWRDHRSVKNFITFVGVSAFPWLMYALNLVFTGALKDFFIANYKYNSELYVHIEGYTPGRFFNPFKLAGAIVHNFLAHYLTSISMVKYVELYLPILNVATWSTLWVCVYLLYKYPIFGTLYFLLLAFTAPRSDITRYSETDYQVGMYLTFGLLSGFLLLYLHRKIELKDNLMRAVGTFAAGVSAVFLVFTLLFLGINTFDKAYYRYIAFMPGISNHSFVSDFMDEITVKGEYAWVGPYEPNHEFFMKNAQLPGKFPTMLPQFRESPLFAREFLAQFEKTPPTVLIFKRTASIFSTPSETFGKFFLTWMEGKYANIEELGYKQVKTPTDFTLKTDLFIHLSEKDKVLQRLTSLGYIQRL